MHFPFPLCHTSSPTYEPRNGSHRASHLSTSGGMGWLRKDARPERKVGFSRFSDLLCSLRAQIPPCPKRSRRCTSVKSSYFKYRGVGGGPGWFSS